MVLVSTGTTVLLVVVALVIIAVLYFINAQRGLVHADELCGNALSQIGVQQSSRWDALTALAELTKSYSEHEHNTLMDVISKRRSITSSSSSAETDAQENMLTEAMGKIMAISESYPELKAQALYSENMASVKEFENNVRFARMTFNDSVTRLNRLTRQFPTSIAASMFGFKSREYLQDNASKSDMPSMRL